MWRLKFILLSMFFLCAGTIIANETLTDSLNKCQFKSDTLSNAQLYSNIDNVILSKINSEVATAILTADTMTMIITPWQEEKLPKKKLDLWMNNLVKYTLCQPQMYSSNKKIYGTFYAIVKILISLHHTIFILELDYNINKWRLLDKNYKELCRYDIHNGELLSLAKVLFPESEIIDIKYNRFIQKYEK